jgi:hypothetical protein
MESAMDQPVRRSFAWLFLLFLSACDRGVDVVPVPPANTASSFCATDFSCPPGFECTRGGCLPIRPALRPHIQTASALLRSVMPGEAAWQASHFDLLIGVQKPDESRLANPNVRLFEYTLIRYHRFDTGPKSATVWALAHGYNPEDFYLHYKVDTVVPTWEGRVIVPGYPAGMVPGWNPGGPGPATATSRSHARVVNYYNGSPQAWYMANIAHPGFRAFMLDRIVGLLDGTWWTNALFASGPLDGIMGDEAIYYAQYKEGLLDRSTEYFGIPLTDDHPYAVAFESFYPELSEALLGRFASTRDVMPNYGHVLFLNFVHRSAVNIQAATPWVWGEVWVTNTGLPTPVSGASRCITYDKDYVNGVRAIVEQTRAGGRRVIGARDTSNGTAGSDRGKLFTLGLYYLLHNSGTYYMYETASGHALPGHVSTWAYNPAVEFNIGQPAFLPAGAVDFQGKTGTREHWIYATGPDPHVPTLTYRVLARRFSRALVLVKMLPLGSVDDSRSTTVHPLGGSYRPLRADGTLGASVTYAILRNNEALILVPDVPTGVQ